MPDKKYNGRRQEIYFPSIQDLQRWRSQAKKYHVPLSKWIYQFVESHLDLDLMVRRALDHAEIVEV